MVARGRVRIERCRRARAGRGPGLLAAAVLLAVGASACSGPDGLSKDDAGRARAGMQRVLDGQADAVEAGDESRYLAAVASGADGYRAEQRRVFGNLQRLPLEQWTYRITSLSRPPAERHGRMQAEARVELGYRLRGYDRAPVVATERLSFVRQHGSWRVLDELPDSDRQLWEQDDLAVVRGERSLVLGSGAERPRLRRLVRAADRAVTAVSREWPGKWPRRVVLEAPATLRQTARLLDAPASSYQGIAAVTTGEAGVSGDAPADRIVVNPEAYGELSEDGRQVVITHETVHVATRTHTSESTPLWLSEGTADWVGYRDSGRTPEQAAPELARAVRKGQVPDSLPSDGEFRFGSDPEAMGRAYEGSWLACRLIAQEWGEDRLTEFYEKAGEGGGGKGGRAAVDRALRDVLGLDRAEFTERWRAYVRGQLD